MADIFSRKRQKKIKVIPYPLSFAIERNKPKFFFYKQTPSHILMFVRRILPITYQDISQHKKRTSVEKAPYRKAGSVSRFFHIFGRGIFQVACEQISSMMRRL